MMTFPDHAIQFKISDRILSMAVDADNSKGWSSESRLRKSSNGEFARAVIFRKIWNVFRTQGWQTGTKPALRKPSTILLILKKE